MLVEPMNNWSISKGLLLAIDTFDCGSVWEWSSLFPPIPIMPFGMGRLCLNVVSAFRFAFSERYSFRVFQSLGRTNPIDLSPFGRNAKVSIPLAVDLVDSGLFSVIMTLGCIGLSETLAIDDRTEFDCDCKTETWGLGKPTTELALVEDASKMGAMFAIRFELVVGVTSSRDEVGTTKRIGAGGS